MNDIIGDIGFLRDNTIIEIIFNVFISSITFVITVTGNPLFLILVKLINWKDRNAIQYRIIGPINKLETKKRASIYFIIEVLKIMIPIIILLGILQICLYWLDSNHFKNNADAYLMIFLCIYNCILCTIIYKTKAHRKLYQFLFIIDVILVDFIILKKVVIYGLINGIEKMAILLIAICIGNYIIIEFLFKKNDTVNKYGNQLFKISMLFKNFIALIYIWLILSFTTSEGLTKIGDKANVILFIVWIILCIVEICMYKNVKFTINKIHGFDITQKAIYQYRCNKVKYILDDGCTKIIDSEEIQSIDYVIENVAGRVKRKRVHCLLKNNDMLNFDGYGFIGDLWVSFYQLNENKKEVKIINNKRIKRIIIEKL